MNMEPSSQVLMAACVALVEELGKAIVLEQSKGTKELSLSVSECKELHGTLTCTKTAISSASSSSSIPHNDTSFFTCISGIQHNLQALHKIVTQIEPNAKNKVIMFNARRIKMFQLDFSLRQKADQLTSLYLNEKKASSSLISDQEGRAFWDQSFGRETVFVPWDKFVRAFEEDQVGPLQQDDLLKKTLDFTNDSFVSVFEFGVFLKWFGPLTGCYYRFQDAFHSGVFCGFVPGMEANMILDGKPEGYYLVRASKTQPGSLAVTFVDEGTQIKHCLLHSTTPFGLTLKSPPTVYQTIRDFVIAHKSKLKYPITHQERASLTLSRFITSPKELAYSLPPGTSSSTSSENEKVIVEPGRENNLCVVCLDATTNTVFLECSHMACCSVCAKSMPVCPVCRAKISRVVTIFRP